MQVQYEPSSFTLQTSLGPASFADPIWMRNEQQVQRHQAPEECFSPLMPAAKVQVAVNPLWSAALKNLLVKWKDGVSFETRLAPGLWPVAPERI